MGSPFSGCSAAFLGGVPLSPRAVLNQLGGFGVTESPPNPNKDLGVVGSLLLEFLRDQGRAQEFGVSTHAWHLHHYLISYLRGWLKAASPRDKDKGDKNPAGASACSNGGGSEGFGCERDTGLEQGKSGDWGWRLGLPSLGRRNFGVTQLWLPGPEGADKKQGKRQFPRDGVRG